MIKSKVNQKLFSLDLKRNKDIQFFKFENYTSLLSLVSQYKSQFALFLLRKSNRFVFSKTNYQDKKAFLDELLAMLHRWTYIKKLQKKIHRS